jgi:PAS domain S-box-containing protein
LNRKSDADGDAPRSTVLPAWLAGHPVAIGVGAASLAALVALNAEAFYLGQQAPWLIAGVLVADMVVVAVGIGAAIIHALRADEQALHAQAALDATQAHLAAVMDSAMDAIITVDESHRVVLFNQAAEAMFGCRRAEALGSTLKRFLPERFRAAHEGHIRHYGKTGITNRRMGDATTLWALRSGGEEFPIEASISQVSVGGRRLYTVILRDITRRKEYEDLLGRQRTELREISARVLEAREEEKTHLARELHDELGQLLTALKMNLAWLRERLPPAETVLAGKAAQMDAVLDRTVGSVRRISAELRPLMLDDLGLADAIGWLTDEFSKNSGIPCTLSAPPEGALADVDRRVAITLYRVLQESLTNIARHSRARAARVTLAEAGGTLELAIEDDGRGIVEADLAGKRSLGLKGMRERVRYLGGEAEIGPAPRGGTLVRVRVPRLPVQEHAA